MGLPITVRHGELAPYNWKMIRFRATFTKVRSIMHYQYRYQSVACVQNVELVDGGVTLTDHLWVQEATEIEMLCPKDGDVIEFDGIVAEGMNALGEKVYDVIFPTNVCFVDAPGRLPIPNMETRSPKMENMEPSPPPLPLPDSDPPRPRPDDPITAIEDIKPIVHRYGSEVRRTDDELQRLADSLSTVDMMKIVELKEAALTRVKDKTIGVVFQEIEER